MVENFSILIPVYNFDVNILVSQLYKEAKKLTNNFEIILIDDKSEPEFIKIATSSKKPKNFNLSDLLTSANLLSLLSRYSIITLTCLK